MTNNIKNRKFINIVIFYTIMSGLFQFIDKLYGASYMLVLNSQKFRLVEISFVLGVHDLVNAIVDYPSGVISDYIGRKKTTGLSLILYSLGLFCFAFARQFVWFVFAVVIIAVSIALYSGSPRAWFYDLMVEHKMLGERNKIMPQMSGIVNGFTVLASLVAFFLIKISIHWPLYIASFISLVIGILYLCCFEDNKGKIEDRGFLSTLKVFTLKFLKDARMRTVVIYNGISYIPFTIFILTWQLYLINNYNVGGEYISLLLIVFMGSMMFSSFYTGRMLKKHNGFKVTIIGKIVIALSLILLCLELNFVTAIGGFILLEIGIGICNVSESIWVNDYISSGNRATFYSALSSTLALFGFLIIMIAGVVIDKMGYVIGWEASIIADLIAVLVLLFFIKKYGKQKEEGEL